MRSTNIDCVDDADETGNPRLASSPRQEANQRNFSDAVERTLIWQIVALGGVFALTFLLPPRPRSKEELERIAAEAGIAI